MGERREVSIISDRPVTRSDLKQERSFFCGSVSTFLQLVVACYSVSVQWTKSCDYHNSCLFLTGFITRRKRYIFP